MRIVSAPARTAAPAAADQAVLISRVLETAGRLANDAAEVITATAGRGDGIGSGSDSAPYDWVTDTDRTLERHTRRVLSAEFSGVPVLGEEYGGPDGFDTALPGVPGAADLLWVVDPLDGSANYHSGLPWCGYSLALLDRDGPLVGVVADPYRAQIYAAARGRRLRANGKALSPFAGPHSGSLVGLPVFTEHRPSHNDPRRPSDNDPHRPSDNDPHRPSDNDPHNEDPTRVTTIARQCHTSGAVLRMLGSPALAITQVALGRAAAAVLWGYRVWEVAGALALAGQVGCSITDLRGANAVLPLDGLIVSDPRIAPAVLELFCLSADGPVRPAP